MHDGYKKLGIGELRKVALPVLHHHDVPALWCQHFTKKPKYLLITKILSLHSNLNWDYWLLHHSVDLKKKKRSWIRLAKVSLSIAWLLLDIY